jgi:hypothetical protein
MTADRSSFWPREMDPFERLEQLREVAPPPELDARVRRRFVESPCAPVGRIESVVNALVVGSYTIYAFGELTRILFG